MNPDDALREYAEQVKELLYRMDMMRSTLSTHWLNEFEGQLLFVRAMTTKHLLPLIPDAPATVREGKS